jgi:hypothetical protein
VVEVFQEAVRERVAEFAEDATCCAPLSTREWAGTGARVRDGQRGAAAAVAGTGAAAAHRAVALALGKVGIAEGDATVGAVDAREIPVVTLGREEPDAVEESLARVAAAMARLAACDVRSIARYHQAEQAVAVLVRRDGAGTVSYERRVRSAIAVDLQLVTASGVLLKTERSVGIAGTPGDLDWEGFDDELTRFAETAERLRGARGDTPGE